MRRLKAWDGARAFFGGIGFVLGKPSTWGWAMVPAVVLIVLASSLCILGVYGASHFVDAMVVGTGDLAVAGRTALTVMLSLVAIALGLLIAFSLTQPLSGFALEAIVRQQDAELGLPPWPKLAFFHAMGHTLAATLLGLAVWLPLFLGLSLLGFMFPPAVVVTIPLKFIASGLLVAWDLLDYPFGLRGEGVSARLRFITQNFGAVFVFGLFGALVVLTPGAGLLLLPFGVAGAARLIHMTRTSPAR